MNHDWRVCLSLLVHSIWLAIIQTTRFCRQTSESWLAGIFVYLDTQYLIGYHPKLRAFVGKQMNHDWWVYLSFNIHRFNWLSSKITYFCRQTSESWLVGIFVSLDTRYLIGCHPNYVFMSANKWILMDIFVCQAKLDWRNSSQDICFGMLRSSSTNKLCLLRIS